MMDINEMQRHLEMEKEAENNAIPFVYGISFSDCLKTSGIATEIEVDGKKIQAHRVYGLWDKYLIAKKHVLPGKKIVVKDKKGEPKENDVIKYPDVFVDISTIHQENMHEWITTKHTDIYKNLTEDQDIWLKDIIRFVVYRRIMDAKYRKWMTTGKGFANVETARKVADVYRKNYEKDYTARLITTILESYKGTPEEKREILDYLLRGITNWLRSDMQQSLLPRNVDDVLQIDGDEE